MRMFGGFSEAWFRRYHELVPKTAPVDEYEQRLQLYECYHHLNHTLMFGVRAHDVRGELGLTFSVRRGRIGRARSGSCGGCFGGGRARVAGVVYCMASCAYLKEGRRV